MTISYPLISAQHATRVRLQVNGTEPVEVQVGDPNETWPVGTYIEVVRVGANASVEFVPFDGSVTLNALTGTVALQNGEYGRVSLVSPGVWDLHVYQIAAPPVVVPPDMLIAFQVGVPSLPHQHFAVLTTEQARTLVNTTDKNLPVGDLGQPTMVITSDEVTGPTGLHTHDLSIQFDYINSAFIVVGISNNGLDNHESLQLGTFRTPIYKPAPMEIRVISALSNQVGSAADHNVLFLSGGTSPISVLVRPDSYWTGAEQYWERNGLPLDPGEMPVGGTLLVGKRGTGTVTFTADIGVTINTPASLTITKLHGKATLTKVGPNEWDLEGNLA